MFKLKVNHESSSPLSLTRRLSYESISSNGSVGVPSRSPRILWIRGALSELSVLAPAIVVLTIALSTMFYKWYKGWEYSTSLYYACQTIVGILYGVPNDQDRLSRSFTLFLYFIGTTYIYAAIAAYANLVAERTVKTAKDIVIMEHVEDLDNDGLILPRDWVVYACNLGCNALDWNHNKFKLITCGATIAWVGVGITYGLLYEEYDLFTSVFFALDAIMLAGSLEPPCEQLEGVQDCTMGTNRALFMILYLLVGSPLFILTMAQFYESLVSSAQLAHQRQKYLSQFSQEEFDYAATCLRSRYDDTHRSSPPGYKEKYLHRSVDMAEFMLLELLRTEAINHDEVQYLRNVFESMQRDKAGTVQYDGIQSPDSDEVEELNEVVADERDDLLDSKC